MNDINLKTLHNVRSLNLGFGIIFLITYGLEIFDTQAHVKSIFIIASYVCLYNYSMVKRILKTEQGEKYKMSLSEISLIIIYFGLFILDFLKNYIKVI